MMRDFTLDAYRFYLSALKKSYPTILRFDQYFKLNPKPESFCLIRHDVDRKPLNALKMAELENSLAVKTTYCFRTKTHTFKTDIISAIAAMGHEIAYHYESLSDARGNMQKAIEDFEKNLAMLRSVVPVLTISMHGSPFSAHDNKDIWKIAENHDMLIHQLNVLGEMYLDIDYSDIAYINDTGRNWTSKKANRRDSVNSKIVLDFRNGQSLLHYLNSQPHTKLVFQIHPERWADGSIEYIVQYSKDKLINFLKALR
jgi:hypothetical protein